jgi:mannitol-1-phosphate 5-dehydrogenase
MEDKPLVVQFGAGAIGRGFLGDLWTRGERAVLFFDVDPNLISLLNTRGSYPLRITGEELAQHEVSPVRAALVTDTAQVTESLAACEFGCTAVGVNAFSRLAPILAAGIAHRFHTDTVNSSPLNIICCENQKDAGVILRNAVAKCLPQDAGLRTYFEEQVAFVDASVGRMVPPPTPELLAEDPLLILAEPYAQLPIDGQAWIGPVPPIPGLQPKINFAGYVARKLFTHNGGHALLAYQGYRRGYEFIWQAAENHELAAELRGYWNETGEALIRTFGFSADEQRSHEADLLQRFRNRALGDTVVRVGRDAARKVRADDRLVGAALLCVTQAIEPISVSRAIAAAYAYDFPDDPTAPQIQQAIGFGGIRAAIKQFSDIVSQTPLADRIATEYATMCSAPP